jgi:hypothetical protein
VGVSKGLCTPLPTTEGVGCLWRVNYGGLNREQGGRVEEAGMKVQVSNGTSLRGAGSGVKVGRRGHHIRLSAASSHTQEHSLDTWRCVPAPPHCRRVDAGAQHQMCRKTFSC